MQFYNLNNCVFTWLIILLLIIIILATNVSTMNAFRQHHQRNKNLQARHNSHTGLQIMTKNLFPLIQQPFVIDTNELNLENDKNKNYYEIKEVNDETKNEENMRFNTGHWNWLEMYSVREEVYMFAFTYFGLITVLLVLLLIMISCCYMYDCMGCYESTKNNKKFGEDYLNSINETKTMELNWIGSKEFLCKTKKERRWSIL
ncbi:hypothetical protein Mgra_00005868 [Meloidogyne graminicola]|uniref:Uncharacterized protein n=1 Tax=Meloidogyne graminicola TaxID=189291 RepID=A0A8S9ZMS9_9BILA|nr:hypothetical protein Mgra_00005868 [Meloidogyne graminicola]